MDGFRIEGVRANVPLLRWIAGDAAYRAGDTTTSFLSERLDESIFAKGGKPEREQVFAAAAAALQPDRAPFRIGGIGIPLRLCVDGSDVEMEASATAQPHVWDITGAYDAQIDLNKVRPDGEARFSIRPMRRLALHGAQGAGNGRIISPMPGKIAKIAVAQGDKVSAHDLLLVLEAMKMEHRIEAPGDGVVGALHVRQGDIVAGDALLLELQ